MTNEDLTEMLEPLFQNVQQTPRTIFVSRRFMRVWRKLTGNTVNRCRRPFKLRAKRK